MNFLKLLTLIFTLIISFYSQAQNNNQATKIFEPFKLKTHRELKKIMSEKELTDLYHQYIFEKNITKEDSCQEFIGSCQYYLCREAKSPCGSNGYNLGFGFQYCSESIENLQPQMSALGKKWLATTATCLQKEMENISYGISCKEQKTEAIEGHDRCYSEISFCKLSLLDITKILKMIKPALTEKGVIIEGIQVLGHCL